MAEKEERILIAKCSSWCHALRVSCDPFDGDDGMYCDKSGKWVRVTEKECAKCKEPVLFGMSRQEAVNLMAKALRSNIVETQAQCSCLNMAEAALNALLEEK